MSAQWINLDKLGTKGIEPDLMPPHREPQSLDEAVNVRALGPNLANAGGYLKVANSDFPDLVAPGEPADACIASNPPDECLRSLKTNGVYGVNRFYTYNWDDKNNKCYLDRPNCPCKCYVGPFDVDESDTAGLGECSKINNSTVCPYFYKTDDDKKYGCEWHRGECTQGRIPCTDNTRTASVYASNTCTLGWGTSDNCTQICQDKYGTKHIKSGIQLWEKECKFSGHSRFCDCVQK